MRSTEAVVAFWNTVALAGAPSSVALIAPPLPLAEVFRRASGKTKWRYPELEFSTTDMLTEPTEMFVDAAPALLSRELRAISVTLEEEEKMNGKSC